MLRGDRVKAAKLDIMIDRLVFEALGRDNDRLVETTLDFSPGVAAELRRNNHRLALTTTVQLPLPSSSQRSETVRLWD